MQRRYLRHIDQINKLTKNYVTTYPLRKVKTKILPYKVHGREPYTEVFWFGGIL